MNPKVESAAELEAPTKEIGEIYAEAGELAKQGIKVYWTDQCTGMQAKERLNAERPLKKGKVRCVEYEYIRHATPALIANFEIASGKIQAPTINETRTEADFVKHLIKTLLKYPEAGGGWFIVDQLNTHKSESLVKLVAEKEGIEETKPGEKGKSGILETINTGQDFLAQAEHRLSFIYTPKHCSGLNQVEIWFSILSKKLIKWGNFKSKKDLKEQLERFIEYFNQRMAKPFKWTFKGFPLRI